MRLKAPRRKFIERERVARVATTGRNGGPHVVPVCHVLDDGKIYFATDKDGKKVKNLRVHPQAAVEVDLYSEDWPRLAGAVITGPATLIERGPRLRKLRSLVYEMYTSTRTSPPSRKGTLLWWKSFRVGSSPGGWTKLAPILVRGVGQDSFSGLRNTT